MRLYVLFLAGFLLLALSNCRAQPELNNQLRTPLVTNSPTPEIGVTIATVTSPVIRIEEEMTPGPLPAQTLTATPTPVVYIVAEGDTLFDIAALNDTTIEAILELNPGLQPELLSIGQELILPEQVRRVPSATSNTPGPTSIVLRGLSVYRTPTNGIWILGEIFNHGDRALENVRLTVTLLDDAGQSVYDAQIWTATNVVAAGSNSPFGLLVIPAPIVEVTPYVVVDSADPIIDLGNRYLEFEVSETEATLEGAQATIRGNIVNVGDMNAIEVALIATLYDDEGNVSGYHKLFLDEPIVAGQSVPFEINVLPPGRVIEDYALLAQGLVDLNAYPE